MRPQKVPNAYGQHESNEDVKLMKVITEVFPFLSHPKADVGQKIAPGQGPDKCKQDEAREIHSRNAGRE